MAIICKVYQLTMQHLKVIMMVSWYGNEGRWWENKNVHFEASVSDMGENSIGVFIMTYRETFEASFRSNTFTFPSPHCWNGFTLPDHVGQHTPQAPETKTKLQYKQSLQEVVHFVQ